LRPLGPLDDYTEGYSNSHTIIVDTEPPSSNNHVENPQNPSRPWKLHRERVRLYHSSANEVANGDWLDPGYGIEKMRVGFVSMVWELVLETGFKEATDDSAQHRRRVGILGG
jgi:hypothetical protein